MPRFLFDEIIIGQTRWKESRNDRIRVDACNARVESWNYSIDSEREGRIVREERDDAR